MSQPEVRACDEVELNQIWDVGRLIDVGATYWTGMPDFHPPLPSFEVRELRAEMEELSADSEFPSYTQEVRMCVQSGTCLETGAHMFREMESIADVGLERLLVSGVVLHIPAGPGEKLTASAVQAALARARERIEPGDAVLVHTGYNRVATNDVHEVNTPHFSYDAIEWLVEQHPAIIGSDMSSWHDGTEEPNFWPMLMRSGVLISPLLVNLDRIDVARVRMIALPMKIQGACAAPCRLIVVIPARPTAE